jgi:DnaD/phage-associated family protein
MVSSGIWGTMFGVPGVVADNFLKLATGEQLKVLLYILRNSGRNCTDEEISVNTGVSLQQVSDAIMFWQQVNVLAADKNQSAQNGLIMSAQIQNQPGVTSAQVVKPDAKKIEAAPPSAEVKKDSAQRQKNNLPPTEIAKLMENSADISELFKTAESILGTLNNTQQNSLIWMFSYLGLKNEVIITLLAYCASIEKTHPAYIEKIACEWSENDINTLNSAQEEVSRMLGSREFTSQIMRSFEMKRRPTAKQSEIIEQWKKIGFNMELIHYAYEKTIEQIDKLSFEYINKILLSWRDSGFAYVKDVKNAESNYKKQKSAESKKDSSDDFDLEKYKIFINNF